MLFSINTVYGQTGLDFEIPPPENSESLDSHNLKLFGRDIQGQTYKSEENQYRIAVYYRNFFKKEGFKELMDNMLPKDTARRIQFRKEELVVEVILTPKEYGTDVGIAKYTLPEGVRKLEDLKLSINDSVFSMPKEDLEGEDLEMIPRPPQSVRLSNLSTGDRTYVTYITELSLDEAMQFYKSKMGFEGWNLIGEVNAGEAVEKYKMVSGKKNLGDSLTKLGSIFQGAANIEEAINQSYLLNFTSSIGSAQINIMPNFLAPDSSTVVQISYAGETLE